MSSVRNLTTWGRKARGNWYPLVCCSAGDPAAMAPQTSRHALDFVSLNRGDSVGRHTTLPAKTKIL
jgi:hypothetical protein